MSEALTIKTPDLAIEISGKIVTSNFDEFEKGLNAFIAGLPEELNSDSDFIEAGEATKILKNSEASLTLAKEAALEQAEQIQSLFKNIDELSDKSRSTRLPLERAIKDRKEEIRVEIINDAAELIDVVNRAPFRLKIAQACKGKRTLETIRAAANACAEEMCEALSENRETIKWFEDSHGNAMTADTANLEQMGEEELKIELQRRQLKIELQRRRERFEHEEKAKELRKEKAQAEARAKAAEAKAEKPAPAKVVDIVADKPTLAEAQASTPIGTEVMEWASFAQTIIDAFGPVKRARASLKHEANKEKAERFANAVVAAWKATREDSP